MHPSETSNQAKQKQIVVGVTEAFVVGEWMCCVVVGPSVSQSLLE